MSSRDIVLGRTLGRALLLLAVLAGCRTGHDYPAVGGPRYAGAPDTLASRRTSADTLRIVSFNIAFAREIDAAITLLSTDRNLRGADVILLQEMDADGTRRIASALGMAWVYYPAIHHRRTRRDFGNAVLARWPIVEDARLVLPRPSRYAGTHRSATAATLQVGAARLRVYSTHLGTVADVGDRGREEQLAAIVHDASAYPMVVIGGDLNDAGVGRVVSSAGYAWPTENGPRTTRFGSWDHVFLKGLRVPDSAAAGVVVPPSSVSDHHPVWVLALVP